jgi:ubiquinone/menaquinone biosynthesis C-methylase UbiE/glycosyltransferase involved in cell wall biosynthesis
MTRSVLLLSRYERKGPSSRVRHYTFIPALERAGLQVTVAPLLDDEYLARYFAGQWAGPKLIAEAYWRRFHQLCTARRYDVIWLEKEALPWLPAAFERTFFAKVPLVIDFDDPWYRRYANHWSPLTRAILGRKFESLIARAAVVTTGNPDLAEWAKALHARRVVEMLPVVDISRYQVAPLPNGPFTIGWIGTPGNTNYLSLIAEPLRHLHEKYGARLRVIGGQKGFSLPGVAIDHIPWSEETEALELSRCHVGVMPLVDGPWERAKSGYKLIQYMAAARPAVASPVGVNASTIVPGEVGFLASNTAEWTSILSTLAANPELVRELGLAARQRVERRHSLERAASALVTIFQETIAARAAERNVDAATVAGFGREWSVFPQGAIELPAGDRVAMFDSYFNIFPWDSLPPNSVGMDVGCGSGRWSVLVAPLVGHVHLVDASENAIAVARTNLAGTANVSFHVASVADLPVPDGSLDFAFAIGVLHHVPDTHRAIECVARKLKPGAPFLVYLYYAFDNRPAWYRWVWQVTNVLRRVLSRSPNVIRYAVSQLIAALIYWPLARTAALLEKIGLMPQSFPLSFYRHRSFYVMRTDAYDRFCTLLEKRFTREEIKGILTAAGFESIAFSEAMPFWCAVGKRGSTLPRARMTP